MKTKTLIRKAVRELKTNSEITEKLKILEGLLQDDLLPVRLEDYEADRYGKSIRAVLELLQRSGESLEAHIDDLSNDPSDDDPMGSGSEPNRSARN
ncbi:hypothetical protein UFOVP558_57 [uncultured Caudovirales phage]|uniref:Uncharacterized protein n=1 Tax=uncultured Caudovirales phage TaxID=2100421 RepID=A0A6J5N271_9CAUD|nr:hypothetical protein UFOVP558_57 [uncultured Caudovirales phage]